MARFVRLAKLTPEGMMNIKELPERFAKGRQYLESLGGKIVDVYAVSGPYDLVAILEAPDEKAVMKHGLFVAQTGYVDAGNADPGFHEDRGRGAEALSTEDRWARLDRGRFCAAIVGVVRSL